MQAQPCVPIMGQSYVMWCDVQEERETLREQLCAVPAEADPTNMAINVAKVRGPQTQFNLKCQRPRGVCCRSASPVQCGVAAGSVSAVFRCGPAPCLVPFLGGMAPKQARRAAVALSQLTAGGVWFSLLCTCCLQLRDLEARLLQEREEKAVLAGRQPAMA